MGFSNCLICFSDLTVVDSSDLETLRTGITNQSMKEFLEEHLLIELDVSSFGSARICDECKVRVDCLEEALVQAKEMKLQLLNDFERSLQKRTEESHIEEDDDCLELVDTLSTDPPSPMIEVNVIATDATETNNDEIQIGDKVPSPSESQDQEYANFWFSDTIDSKFACHTCGVKYNSRHSLKSHILTKHLDVGRICCLVCGKFFNQKGSLKKHMRIHTRERNFQCHLCGRRFIHETSLKGHTAMHLDIRKAKCDVCGLEMRNAGHLKRHMKTHTGEKPYSCPDCGRTFAVKYNMNLHLQNMHGRSLGKKLPCVICLETFEIKSKLNLHLTTVHNVVPEEIAAKGAGESLCGKTKRRRK